MILLKEHNKPKSSYESTFLDQEDTGFDQLGEMNIWYTIRKYRKIQTWIRWSRGR